LKTQRLDEGKGNWLDAGGSGLGIEPMLELGKHGIRIARGYQLVKCFAGNGRN
jgi:hypothetical protein